MPEVTTQVDPDDSLRPLYEAARRVGYLSAATRTFEQWCEKVSDHELDDARRVIEIESKSEHKRLEREVIATSKAEHQAQKIYLLKPTPENIASYHDAKDQRQRAVNALMEFEAKQE